MPDFERGREIVIELEGRIDSGNSAQAEELIESDAVKNAFMTTTAAHGKTSAQILLSGPKAQAAPR